MDWFKKLTPQQRQLLLIGVPVVAVFALVVALRGGGGGVDGQDDEAGPDAAVLPGSFAPAGGNDAIGVGQLASYEEAVTSELDMLQRRIEDERNARAEAIARQEEAYQDFLNDVAGSRSALPSGGFKIDDPPERIGVYTIGGELVRVGGDPAGGNANTRLLSEYGASGGQPGIIDSTADLRFVERARGVKKNDPTTARLILEGSFGPVAQSFRPTLEKIANR